MVRERRGVTVQVFTDQNHLISNIHYQQSDMHAQPHTVGHCTGKMKSDNKKQEAVFLINEMGRPWCVWIVSSLVDGRVRKEGETLGLRQKDVSVWGMPHILLGKNRY